LPGNFQSGRPKTIGLTAGLVRPNENETGKTAQEYRQDKAINVAKEKIFNHSKPVNMINGTISTSLWYDIITRKANFGCYLVFTHTSVL